MQAHHRQIHTTDWAVRLRDGLPEFIPPPWIDPERRPRRRPRTSTLDRELENTRVVEFA
ncbi:hypothetical protein ACFQH9_11255 [Pseudonocardia lutea]|uniref:Uncharacterized protein n=1 Tax=Pseudonocardia lutea TaxID=2172015 RepID=A0ABW1I8Z2_9PSEU